MAGVPLDKLIEIARGELPPSTPPTEPPIAPPVQPHTIIPAETADLNRWYVGLAVLCAMGAVAWAVLTLAV